MAHGADCVRMPKYPDAGKAAVPAPAARSSSCELLVKVGDVIARDDNLLTLETGKVALDIPTPRAGRVVEIHVREGDTVGEGALLAILEAT